MYSYTNTTTTDLDEYLFIKKVTGSPAPHVTQKIIKPLIFIPLILFKGLTPDKKLSSLVSISFPTEWSF